MPVRICSANGEWMNDCRRTAAAFRATCTRDIELNDIRETRAGSPR